MSAHSGGRAADLLSLLTAEIRPGIFRPDWSVVSAPAARAALTGRAHSRSGLSERWAQALGPTPDFVWRTVLELFAEFARPPSLSEIAATTGLSVHEVGAIVADLQAHDLLAMDTSATTIRYADPFAAQPTDHRVELHGRMLHAVCGIDALGVAGMFRTDPTIESSCRTCGSAIKIGTAQSGRALGYRHPVESVVWYDFAYSQTAAASCCPAIAFFCSDEHQQGWLLAQSPERIGRQLTLDEALEVGRALFETVLAGVSTG